MAEKTEKATPKKLLDARKKAQVAKSQDLPAAFTFIVAIAITLAIAKTISKELGSYIIAALKASRHSIDLNTMISLLNPCNKRIQFTHY